MSDTKRCKGPCGQVLSLAEFGPTPVNADGKAGKCRKCTNAYKVERNKKLREAKQSQTIDKPADPPVTDHKGSATEYVYTASSDGQTMDEQPQPVRSAVERFDELEAEAESCQECGALPPGHRCIDHEPEDPLVAMTTYGTNAQREAAEQLIAHGSVQAAAEALDTSPEKLRATLGELHRTSARRGWSPAHDMIKPVPPGFHVKGVSTYYRNGEARGQWVKSKVDEQHKVEALLDALSGLADQWKGKADPSVLAPLDEPLDDDLLCVYPMGDPHLGMYAWGLETGGRDFDLAIAERNLCAAVDRLVARAPRAKQALIINLGDFFHADSTAGTTTKGTRVDTDTRWGKVLRVGIRAMRRCIDQALLKHESVRVICEIGNHDDHSSVMLALALEQFYEREPRVEIDTSPAKLHWFRFGQNLIAVTHGDTLKMADMPLTMACDRKRDWGETEYRYAYTGHVHHDSLKEYPGVIVESFRTLAPNDQ